MVQFHGSEICWQAVVATVAMLLLTGCHTGELQQRRSTVSGEIANRFGTGLSTEMGPGQTQLPPGITTDNGITEEEAITVALWNNAAYQELLAQLGVSNAQLLDAGLIADPQFQLFFPLGPKQLEFTTFQAVDALWLQPIRVKAAELDVDRVTHSMVQNGLNVIRDARVAHANLVAASEQAEVAREAAALRQQIADLANKRLDAGDISELEFTTSRIDALQAKAAAERAEHDVTLARERLRTVMGLVSPESRVQCPEMIVTGLPLASGLATLNSDDLVDHALAMRPDLRAAEIASEAASERARLAEYQFMNLDAIYDANGQGTRGFESGPGLRFSIPIFNRNQGGIAIADAQWQQAARQYVTIRDQVTLDVRSAHTQLVQASENLNAVRGEILPTLREAEELARRNYENGGTPYFLVLQTTGQYLDARLRESQLAADLRRAIAELDRSVGHRISDVTAPAPLPQVPPVEAAAQANNDKDPQKWRATRTGDPTQTPRPLPAATIDAGPIARIPLQISLDEDGRVSAVSTASHSTVEERPRQSRMTANRKKKRRSQDGNAGDARSKNRNQGAEHVQVTIDIRLDPRLVPAGVRSAESGLREENCTSED
ncbi:MAG: TolC family protein [Planctomycetota bacterium]